MVDMLFIIKECILNIFFVIFFSYHQITTLATTWVEKRWDRKKGKSSIILVYFFSFSTRSPKMTGKSLKTSH